MSNIYQFKITLADSAPPIWRRVQVPDNFTLEELHHVIQHCFHWEQCHRYAFEYQGERYDDEGDSFLANKLCDLDLSEEDQLGYVYDLGDDWEHTLLLEKVMSEDKEKIYPCCVAGELAAPPEDAGGMWGYEEKLAVLSEEDHPEYEETLRWIGKDFDPDVFDLQSVNERLSALVSVK